MDRSVGGWVRRLWFDRPIAQEEVSARSTLRARKYQVRGVACDMKDHPGASEANGSVGVGVRVIHE